MTLWIGHGAVLLKTNNSWPKLFNFQNSTNCHLLELLRGNIVDKGKIAHFEQFHLFPRCSPEAFFFNVLKMSIYVYGRKGLRHD